MPAHAADPIFPTGSRIGLVPPPGMAASRNFEGFDNPDKNAAILLNALPAAAYDQLDKSMVPETMRKQGIEVDRREPVTLPAGKGFVLSGKQTINNVHYRKWLLVAATGELTALVTVQIPEQDTTYPDKTVRDALATLAVRDSVPEAEQLKLLPFTIGDLAGFHIKDVLPGRAIMLVDTLPDKELAAKIASADRNSSDKNPPDANIQLAKIMLKGRMFIAAVPGGPRDNDDHGNFARVTFDEIVGVKDVRVQDAEPLRIGNQSGYQTLAKAKDPLTDTDIMVVQWLRFGTGGFLQMIGIAQADIWTDVLTRLRAVRDSIDVK